MSKIMKRSYKELRDKMSPEARARAEEKTKQMLAEMPLNEIRQARKLSQEHLAQILHVNQASISKLERRTDMYISTLRDFIEAMGGRLEIKAVFQDGVVIINQFQTLVQEEEITTQVTGRQYSGTSSMGREILIWADMLKLKGRGKEITPDSYTPISEHRYDNQEKPIPSEPTYETTSAA